MQSAPASKTPRWPFAKAPGARTEAGGPVAGLVDPTADDPAHGRIELKSQTDGVMFGRNLLKFAIPGQRICTIAGAVPLADPEDWSKLED